MKKLIAILLLIVFWFSAVGYFHVFRLMQAEVRHSIKSRLEKDIPEQEMTILSFSSSEKINWTRKGKEFRHEGKMYDVIRKQEKNGNIIFYCIDDSQETTLVSHMEKLLKDNVNNDKSTSSNSFRIILDHFPNLFFQDTLHLLSLAGNYHFLQVHYLHKTLEGFLPNFTPPPVIG